MYEKWLCTLGVQRQIASDKGGWLHPFAPVLLLRLIGGLLPALSFILVVIKRVLLSSKCLVILCCRHLSYCVVGSVCLRRSVCYDWRAGSCNGNKAIKRELIKSVTN